MKTLSYFNKLEKTPFKRLSLNSGTSLTTYEYITQNGNFSYYVKEVLENLADQIKEQGHSVKEFCVKIDLNDLKNLVEFLAHDFLKETQNLIKKEVKSLFTLAQVQKFFYELMKAEIKEFKGEFDLIEKAKQNKVKPKENELFVSNDFTLDTLGYKAS